MQGLAIEESWLTFSLGDAERRLLLLVFRIRKGPRFVGPVVTMEGRCYVLMRGFVLMFERARDVSVIMREKRLRDHGALLALFVCLRDFGLGARRRGKGLVRQFGRLR